MKKSVIVEGNSYESAVEKGLELLNAKREDVDIVVIEEGQVIEGIVLKPYVIRVSLREEKPFSLEYREDGVYLTVFPDSAKDDKIDWNKVIHHLHRKKIENCDTKAVFRALYNLKGQPVKIAPPQQEKSIDEEANIRISNDEMEAYITLLPPEDGKLLSEKEIFDLLRNHGVVFGIDENAVKELFKKREYGKEILVARGTFPQNGKDAKLIFHVNLNKNPKPKVKEDGSVDYYNLGLIENVKKGQVLATIVPPTEGVPGKTVSGKSVPPKPGRSIVAPIGKNVILSEDGCKLLAAIDGEVEIIDGKINVFSVHEVAHDVDHSTGNIDFVGNVVINGNVLTGFEVKAEGYIEIRGIVEGARLIAKGDIVIKGGVQGRGKGIIQSEGNVIARYIENANVIAFGNIVAEAIMHSNVQCMGSIEVSGRKGLIVGGNIYAAGEISAQIVGSPMATATNLEVGVDPRLREEYSSLEKELNHIRNELNKLEQMLTLFEKLEKASPLSYRKKMVKIKAMKTRELYNKRMQKINERMSELKEKFRALEKTKINIRKIVYPGVKITIDNSTMHIREELHYVTFKKEKGELIYTVFEE